MRHGLVASALSPLRLGKRISLIAPSLSSCVLCAQAFALPTTFGPVTYGDFGAAEGDSGFTVSAGPKSNSLPDIYPASTSLQTSLKQTLNGPATSVSFNDPQLGNYSASVSLSDTVASGIIHASGSGSATATGELASSATLGVTLFWFDTITMQGQGTQNAYLISLHNDIQALSVSGSGNAHFDSSLNVVDMSTGKNAFNLEQCHQATANDSYCAGNTGRPFAGVIFANPGQQFVLEEQFTMSALAQAAPSIGLGKSSKFNINLTDTAFFTLDAQTAGAGYITGSGINYASSVFPPVPETSAWMMFIAGLGALGWAARRARAAMN